jgi:hypothetical protein
MKITVTTNTVESFETDKFTYDAMINTFIFGDKSYHASNVRAIAGGDVEHPEVPKEIPKVETPVIETPVTGV